MTEKKINFLDKVMINKKVKLIGTMLYHQFDLFAFLVIYYDFLFRGSYSQMGKRDWTVQGIALFFVALSISFS